MSKFLLKFTSDHKRNNTRLFLTLVRILCGLMAPLVRIAPKLRNLIKPRVVPGFVNNMEQTNLSTMDQEVFMVSLERTQYA